MAVYIIVIIIIIVVIITRNAVLYRPAANCHCHHVTSGPQTPTRKKLQHVQQHSYIEK